MKRKIKTKITIGILLLFLLTVVIGNPKANASAETVINISNTNIEVNGEEISSNADNSVYKTKNTEKNTDITDSVENTVINIVNAGTYRISGTAENTQIAINAENKDEIILVLDNCNITCSTAPAIIVYNALDTEKAGEAGVTIKLEDDSSNTIIGSHIPKESTYIVNGETKSYDAKYDGAISSDVSLKITGTGLLNVDGDKEGIETKLHLTIDNGNINITSNDDAINASEDSVSVITINDGTIYANIKAEAEEGDGIDSNGYIYINGGQVYAFASATSQDSGLDSDLGIYINGGTVIGTGNMVDEVSKDSSQQYIFLQFPSEITAGSLICITDEKGTPIMAYKTDKNYQTFLYSAPNLDTDSYKVYTGGTIQGEENNGLYTKIDSYTDGTEIDYSEANESRGMNSQINENMQMMNEENSNTIYIGIGLIIIGGILILISFMCIKNKN